MELLQQPNLIRTTQNYAPPTCIARYSPVFWEPLAGTGERIVALVALEPHESSATTLAASTYCVLPPERLRAMLGRQRGNAAQGVLREVAAFMTHRQMAGLPVADLEAPFKGFTVGPAFVARGYSIEQLLDAAVRSVSAFGKADDLIDEEESPEPARHTVKTAEFLKTLKRQVAGDNAHIKARFEKVLHLSQNLPELTVDYAFEKWMVQVTSLPATPKQAVHTLRESQSKLYEIEMIRRHLQGNAVTPVLLINEDVLYSQPNELASRQAHSMLERLQLLAQSNGLEVLRTSSAYEAAELVVALGS